MLQNLVGFFEGSNENVEVTPIWRLCPTEIKDEM